MKPKFCCDEFKEAIDYNKYLVTTDEYGDTLETVHIRYLDACYPECGPIYDHIPINFCPKCGAKIEYEQ